MAGPLDPVSRCWWACTPLEIAYHDEEWGVPIHDDRRLFELLMLEAFQAGLSWSTILQKRDNFRTAFDQWDARTIAGYGDADIARLLANSGIVRSRQKIRAAIRNAAVFLDLQAKAGSFDRFIWSFRPEVGTAPESPAQLFAATPASEALSKQLKRAGMTFVGPTICYAFMQSAGLVNDHLVSCFRRTEVDSPLPAGSEPSLSE